MDAGDGSIQDPRHEPGRQSDRQGGGAGQVERQRTVGEKGILALLGLRRDLIGLDVDARSVRMVQLRRRNGDYTVVGASTTDVEPWAGDQSQHRANTVRAIREGFGALEPGGNLAVCGLKGPEVVVRGFEFPGMPKDEVESAVGLEASQACPFSCEGVTLAHQVTSGSDRRALGYWAAATERLIEDRRQLAYEAGLHCALMDVDGLALLNCLDGLSAATSSGKGHGGIADGDRSRAAILHMGDSYTTIAIVDQAGRPFVRDVSSSGQEVVRQVSQEAGLSEDAALAALNGGPGSSAIPTGCLERGCSHLLDDVVTTLRYYTAKNPLAKVNQVLVCGRFALVPSIIDLLGAKLPYQVTVWNPVADLRCEASPRCEELLRTVGPAMAIATGLALRRI